MDGRYCQRRINLQKIILSDSHKKILKEHAKKKHPNESCALLFGIAGDTSEVKEVFLTENIENSPINFTVSNEQLIEGYKKAEEKNMDVVGIFHSHPNSDAVPSNIDKKFMETNPVVWVIFSGISEKFRAYILDNETKEIPIES